MKSTSNRHGRGERVGLFCCVAAAATVPLLFCKSVQANPPTPGFHGLGTFTGGLGEDVRGITNGGVAVGSSSSGGWRWTAATGYQALPASVGGERPQAYGVSASGAVIAGLVRVSGTGLTRAVSWNGLAYPPTPASQLSSANSQALGVSFDGHTIVGVSTTGSTRWVNGVEMPLTSVADGGLATGASADGTVITGYTHAFGSQFRAFRWTQATGMQNLGVLPGRTDSTATAISADASVIVGNCGFAPFRWTSGTGMQPLPFLPSSAYAIPWSVSGDGSIVVGDSIANENHLAVAWMPSLGIIDLNVYLPTLGIDLTGWTLTYAQSVSADGFQIGGTGYHNGVSEAWIATIPAPAATPLLAAAAAISCSRGRRRL